MSYEYRIGKRVVIDVSDSSSTNVSDDQELQRMYKNSKFTRTSIFIRDTSHEQWVFLSHSNKDYHAVRKLRNILENEGQYPLMFFLKCMNDEDELDSLLKREIECRTRFILCDSNNAKESKWVQREVAAIKALNRIYETINIDNLEANLSEAKAKVQQLSKRSTIILSFDQEHEHLAYQMYSRLMKYDFKVLLFPLFDFEAKEDFECINGSYADLIDKGLVVVLVGEWIRNPGNATTQDLLRAIELDNTNENSFILPVVFETKIHNSICTDSTLQRTLSPKMHSTCHLETPYRVNDAIDGILTRMLNPSSMIVYIESFRRKNDEKLNFEAVRLTTLLHQNARPDRAGDIAALAKCQEMGWGCEKNYHAALQNYTKAQEAIGYSLYQDDIERIKEQIHSSQIPKKIPFWKKLFQLLGMWFFHLAE